GLTFDILFLLNLTAPIAHGFSIAMNLHLINSCRVLSLKTKGSQCLIDSSACQCSSPQLSCAASPRRHGLSASRPPWSAGTCASLKSASAALAEPHHTNVAKRSAGLSGRQRDPGMPAGFDHARMSGICILGQKTCLALALAP